LDYWANTVITKNLPRNNLYKNW